MADTFDVELPPGFDPNAKVSSDEDLNDYKHDSRSKSKHSKRHRQYSSSSSRYILLM